MRSLLSFFVSTGFLLSVFFSMVDAAAVTPAQWLQKQTRPVFKTGHTLPLLGQMHCTNPPIDVRLELAGNWGYAVRFSRPTGESQLISACNANPVKYKAAAMIGNQGNLIASFPSSSRLSGNLLSPEMPDADYIQYQINDGLIQIAGQIQGLPATQVGLVENWTESGLNVPADYTGTSNSTVLAAKGNQSWQTYISRRKAHYDSLYRVIVKQHYPNAFYTAYTYSGVIGRQPDWVWDWKYMKVATDLPSPQLYYNSFNSGFVGNNNMINAYFRTYNGVQTGIGVEISEGTPHSYGWVCAGYQRDIATYWGDPSQGMYADMPRWMGYLKMMYTASMLGATTTGEFGCSVNYGTFEETTPPKWLDQIAVLGQAHALFSWLETDLRNSDLLPGPWTTTVFVTLPSYEFAVNGATSPSNTHVIARKVKNDSTWLVCAWSADNVEKDAAVNIPILGAYTIHARPCGTVMLVHKTGTTVTSQWYDSLGMTPSLSAAALNGGVAVKKDLSPVKSQTLDVKVCQNAQGIVFILPNLMQGHISLSITDLRGKQIAQIMRITAAPGGAPAMYWNTASQSSGIYVARVQSEGKTLVQKIVLGGR